MRDHRPQTAAHLLDSDGLTSIQQRAAALSQLNTAVKSHLNCAEHCRVSNYRQGVLIIETESAAWSMRLNYERYQLTLKLREKLLPKLREIEVKVNPILAAVAIRKQDKIPDIIQKPISHVAAQHLLATAANAPDKVKVCLERLAKLAQKNTR
ncbi:DUF721 domain-containing protein [Photobacterium carnosum]|jgi:hypothetical protein|uniref:DUF721 domain-containing protein n=1 Tax=Photobacterium carnosum TaxID=2023717 RepID=UPI001E3053A3|nr:DciA family protein [Photobacterium carnosum]MCD9499620.1 DUF721 domain-containing protein [Photobacterium carnosum]MCD9526751.1 DUF721 domain-containing protein [Photobacterium carnosum]MCD9529873.1 DUF721 domain-containing protein [Photobacterium carnosum]MCD9538362.1 DUF721 domain-containing protein [Photobacterium carnosum]MCD9541472.1 DUF721 domain-containing protein [Photobacterium carnosum]